MVRKEASSLVNVVAATAQQRGADDTDDLGKQLVVLRQRTRVFGAGLQLRVGGEEARRLDGTEEIGVQDVLGASSCLTELEK